jgi:hypothetical protein
MGVVSFPARSRVLCRLGLEKDTEANEITSEIRRLDNSIAALRTRRAALITLYKKQAAKAGPLIPLLGGGVALIVLRVGHAGAYVLENSYHTAQLLTLIHG